MTAYKTIVEEYSCKPNTGCGTATICMCALADDMADEIERQAARIAELESENKKLNQIEKEWLYSMNRIAADFTEMANQVTQICGFTHFAGFANGRPSVNCICPKCHRIVEEGGEYPCGDPMTCGVKLARDNRDALKEKE